MDKVKIICRALTIDDQDRVLFVKKTGSDLWSLPGGTLDASDESAEACLTRELREELGVEAVIEEIRFVQELHKNDTHYIELIWQVTLASDPMFTHGNISEVSHGELVDIRWIKKGALSDTEIKPEFLKQLV